MNKSVLTCVFAFFAIALTAQEKVLPLYNGVASGSEQWTWSERTTTQNIFNQKLVSNVSKPTLTVFQPDASVANGTAVIIFPGGGFHMLAIDNEGFEVAKWLAKKGITAFVLKYRLVHTVTDDPAKEFMANVAKRLDVEYAKEIAMAMADAQASVAYVRSHAAEFKINPKKVGVIGFSAGGTLVGSTIYSANAENRPDFAAPIYAYLTPVEKKEIPKDAPPVFIVVATDDQFGLVSQSVQLYSDWLAAKHPVELHVFTKGGHGFGMKKQNLPSDHWIEMFGEWMASQGLLKSE